MRTGFTFKNKHSREFGITAATKSRPIIPERRSSVSEIPNRDGGRDYAYINDYGRAMYTNRVFTVILQISAANIFILQKKISLISTWLAGSGTLIFDDMPGVIWDASVVDLVDYAPEKGGKAAILNASFKVQPFSKAPFNVGDGICLGDDIMIGSDIPLSIEEKYKFVCTGTEAEYDCINIGTAPARPVIIVFADSDIGEWSVSCGGRCINIAYASAAQTSYRLDLDNYTLIGTGKNLLGLLSGRFFELMPGHNTLSFAFPDNKTNQTYNIAIYYTPEFLYNADYGGGYDA